MAKMTIDEQIAEAERRVRKLKERKVREDAKRRERRYALLVEAVPDIDGYDDDEYADFVQRLARDMATSTDIVPEPSDADEPEGSDASEGSHIMFDETDGDGEA